MFKKLLVFLFVSILIGCSYLNVSAKNINNQGTKGKNLYAKILNKHISAIKNNWGYSEYLENGYSIRYPLFRKGLLEKVGYAYYDINSDGTDELFIGEIAKGKTKGTIFEIYSISSGKPVHVFAADNGARYFVCSNNFLCVDDKISKNKNIFRISYIDKNSAALTLQAQYMYDTKKDKKNPWFVNYGISKKTWQPIPKQEYDNARKIFGDYKRFDYIPLAELDK